MGHFLYPPNLNNAGSGSGGIAGTITNAPTAGSHNDYLPTGFLRTKAKVLFTLAGDTTLTGLDKSNFADGDECVLCNFAGVGNLILSIADAGSLAANRFFGIGGAGNSVALPQGASQLLVRFTSGGNSGWIML